MSKCEGCKHHVVYYDMVDGRECHDGCQCNLEREKDCEDLDHDDSCSFDKECPYKEGE